MSTPKASPTRGASFVTKRSHRSGKTFFLGIAIDQYQHWRPLRNAKRDVVAVKDLLVQSYGLAAERVELLLDEDATRANIIRTLEALPDRVKEPDSIIIYYAGHGHLGRFGSGYWIPVEAAPGSVEQYIPNSTIRDYLGYIESLHTLLICDACFSGTLFVRGGDDRSLAARELSNLPSRWALCSGRHDEEVSDGQTNGHSPFAESILDVLGRGDRDHVTAQFLTQQVTEQTRANYRQLPDGGPLQGVGHKRGQYVFWRDGAAPPSLDRSVPATDRGTPPEAPPPPTAEPAAPPTVTDLPSLKRAVRDLIGEDDFPAAIDLLLEHTRDDRPFYNEVLLQKARKTGLDRQIRQGTIGTDMANQTTARIRQAILSLLDEVRDGDVGF